MEDGFRCVQKAADGLVCNCRTIVRKKCHVTKHEKLRKSVLQYNDKQDLILISKKIFFLYACNLDVFRDKGMVISQIKLVFFPGL